MLKSFINLKKLYLAEVINPKITGYFAIEGSRVEKDYKDYIVLKIEDIVDYDKKEKIISFRSDDQTEQIYEISPRIFTSSLSPTPYDFWKELEFSLSHVKAK